MNAKTAVKYTAYGAALFVSGRAIYQLTEDRIKLSLADRRERKLKKDIAALQRQLNKDALQMVIRFETTK